MRSGTPSELSSKVEFLLTRADWIITALQCVNPDCRKLAAPALRASTIDDLHRVCETVMKEVEETQPLVKGSRYFNDRVWILGRRNPILPAFRFCAMRFPADVTKQLRERAKCGKEFYVPPDDFARVVRTLCEEVNSGVYDAHLSEDFSFLLFKELLSFSRSRCEAKS